MTDEVAGSENDQSMSYVALPHDLGTYVVTTASGSVYVFQLSTRTVTRVPGPGSAPGPNDGPRTLRSVDACTVGAPGYWTLIAGDPMVDFLWQSTSPIVSIVDSVTSEVSKADEGGDRRS
jgi:hypothetical protein